MMHHLTIRYAQNCIVHPCTMPRVYKVCAARLSESGIVSFSFVKMDKIFGIMEEENGSRFARSTV